MKSVSVVIPTRNEEKNIVRVIGEAKKTSPSCNIIVVDDSDDGRTRDLALCSGARVIKGKHKGLGQAIIDGIRASGDDVVVVMDADLSHPPIKIPELVRACQDGYGMAIGSRYVKGGGVVGWTTKRKIISLVASWIAYPITRVRDNTSGFFAFNRSILDGISLCPTSWKIMLEVLVKTGVKSVEIPIEFKDREAGKSKFNTKEIFAYLKHLFKLALHKFRILNFMIVGGIGYFINVGIYYPLTLWFEETTTFFGQEFYLPPFIISSYVAMSSNYLMNKMSTFKDYQEKKLGYVKYITTCAILIPIEMIMIWLFVHFLGMEPVAAVALVILLVFIARYTIVSNLIWRKSKK